MVYLNPFEASIQDGLTIISAVKNRTEFLMQSLENWLAQPSVDEIILVDWDSQPPVQDAISEYSSKRIILVHVSNQSKWHLSKAYNLAARFASRTCLLKLDADILIKNNLLEQIPPLAQMFLTGSWRVARNENEVHLNGVLCCQRSDFFRVNGYSENITTYGYDDDDLYKRLHHSGLKRMVLRSNNLFHIPHGDELRLKFQPGVRDCASEIRANKIRTQKMTPWSTSNPMTYFQFISIDKVERMCRMQELAI